MRHSLLVLWLFPLALFAGDTRPNFLILFTDDQRWDTLGCYNDACPIETPNIDRLAEQGVRFTNGFVTTPICAVSRGCLQTGRYASNNRMHAFHQALPEDVFEHTYPLHLQRAGYFTGHFGKYGIGFTEAQAATFDRFEGQASQGPKFREYKGRTLHDSEWLTAMTRDFLDALPEGLPFVLQLSYKAPHDSSCPAPEDDHLLDGVTFERSPYDKREYFERLPQVLQRSLSERCYVREFNEGGDHNLYLRDYHEKIVSVERSVGEVMAELERRGLADNTVVFFLSDHGTHFGEKQLGGKWTPYDESLRVPFIVYDPRPGSRRGAVAEELVLSIDVAPTLLEMAGLVIPEVMDGRSLVPLLEGDGSGAGDWRTRFAYEHFTSPARIMAPLARNDGIRTADFKYVRWTDPDPVIEELYDLREDPAEVDNRVGDPAYADELAGIRATYRDWRAANPENYDYQTYGRRPQSGSPEIDWDRFAAAHPEHYDKIRAAIEALGVSWKAAMEDPEVRYKVSKKAGYWY